MGEIRYSDEQKLIINKPAKVGNTVVIAYAGCGKSTTLIGFAYARKGKRILYLVFNRSAAKDAEKKFPKFVDVLTMNGLAYRSKTSDGLRERIAKKLSYILFLDDLKEIEPNSERRLLCDPGTGPCFNPRRYLQLTVLSGIELHCEAMITAPGNIPSNRVVNSCSLMRAWGSRVRVIISPLKRSAPYRAGPLCDWRFDAIFIIRSMRLAC
jgi:hypothetical protein